MKQMSLIEMDGFLKGKCIPSDLKVNETNAEYLVRKFAEAEAKISALSEDHQKAIESIKQADAAVKLAHEKFSALAAENSILNLSRAVLSENVLEACNAIASAGFRNKAIMKGFYASTGNGNKYPNPISTMVDEALSELSIPVTDAFLAEVRAQAFNDLCSVFVKDATVAGLDDGDIVTVKDATDALLHCAEQLRKGGNQ
ncbi:hypothetical protein DLS19_13155 [Escherichia coli]|nr:hypothetical protein [Escherichia coli]EFO3501216.1 hypothetical protein [Escherichia coli]EFO3506498.1 hypothetical protein [Escherichia coli]